MIKKQHLLCTVVYDGFNYCGLVKQPDEKTIIGTMENAFKNAFKEEINIMSAGRTDAGVHALDQKISFHTIINPEIVVKYWNKSLPHDIKVCDCKTLNDSNFHVRFSVREKQYLYKIIVSDTKEPFLFRQHLILNSNLNIELLRKSLKIFVGKHDFTSVATLDDNKINPIREIKKINFEQKDNQIIIEFVAKSFLRHMIRRIIGSAIEVGHKNIDLKNLNDYFKNKKKIPYIAPANGLYLKKIEY